MGWHWHFFSGITVVLEFPKLHIVGGYHSAIDFKMKIFEKYASAQHGALAPGQVFEIVCMSLVGWTIVRLDDIVTF